MSKNYSTTQRIENLLESLADDIAAFSDEELKEYLEQFGMSSDDSNQWFEKQIQAGVGKAKKQQLVAAREQLDARAQNDSLKERISSVEEARRKIRLMAMQGSTDNAPLTLAARQGSASLSDLSDKEILSLAEDFDDLSAHNKASDDGANGN